MGQFKSKQRRTPSLTSRLADVELQTVMHGLTANERLLFARCCKRTMHAASVPFAWQGALLQVNCSVLLNDSVLLSPLTRLIPVALDLRNLAAAGVPLEAVDILLSALNRGLRIVELDATWCWHIPNEQWVERLLPRPEMQSIRALKLHRSGFAHAELMRLVCRLPLLQSLTIVELNARSQWAMLPSASMLTELHIADSMHHERNLVDPLESIAACTKLTRLSLSNPKLHEGAFRPFFTSPNMCRLQWLKLQDFNFEREASEDPVRLHMLKEDYLAAFVTLHSLHTLHLHRCFGADLALPLLLPSLSSLGHLILEPAGVDVQVDSSVPTVATLVALLQQPSHPHLKCTMILHPRYLPRRPKDADDEQIRVEFPYTVELRRRFSGPLLASFGRRFKLESVDF